MVAYDIKQGRAIDEAIKEFAPHINSVPIEDLDPALRDKWLVLVDVEGLVAKQELAALILAKEEQKRLAGEYRQWRIQMDTLNHEPSAAKLWLDLIRAVGNKATDDEAFHEKMGRAILLVDSGISKKQKVNASMLTKAVLAAGGPSVAGQLASEMQLGSPDLSKLLDWTDKTSWTIKLAPLAYGATVDDEGKAVNHYILWSKHRLVDPTKWVGHDLEVLHRTGFGGFVGFSGEPVFDADDGKIGFTGTPATYQIEQAISSRFDPALYKICWYVNPAAKMTVPGLPHLHLWVAEKTNVERTTQGRCEMS